VIVVDIGFRAEHDLHLLRGASASPLAVISGYKDLLSPLTSNYDPIFSRTSLLDVLVNEIFFSSI
jgi:hypothetical protein